MRTEHFGESRVSRPSAPETISACNDKGRARSTTVGEVVFTRSRASALLQDRSE
jgi:hypothetical protein